MVLIQCIRRSNKVVFLANIVFYALIFTPYYSLARIVPYTCIRQLPNLDFKQEYCRQLPVNYNLKKKTRTRVCAFHNGNWKLGNISVDPTSSTPPFTYVFNPKHICNKGIMAIEDNFSGEIKGPKQWDIHGSTVVTYDSTQQKFVSTKNSGIISLYDTARKCVIKSRGPEPASELNCVNDPNAVGYCKFLTNVQQPGFSGKWWARYGGANQKNPVICSGGVRILDLQAEANSYNKSFLYTSTQKVDKSTYFSNNLPAISSGYTQDIAACFVYNPSGKIIRHACGGNIMSKSQLTDSRKRGDCIYIEVSPGAYEGYKLYSHGIVQLANKVNCAFFEVVSETTINPSIATDDE